MIVTVNELITVLDDNRQLLPRDGAGDDRAG